MNQLDLSIKKLLEICKILFLSKNCYEPYTEDYLKIKVAAELAFKLVRITRDRNGDEKKEFEKLTNFLVNGKKNTKFMIISRFFILSFIQKEEDILSLDYFKGKTSSKSNIILETLGIEFNQIKDDQGKVDQFRKWISQEIKEKILFKLLGCKENPIG